MNYFNYFTEVEEHFQRRRGTILLLSTLDWTLIEMWREADIPLEAVLRGIDAAFDKRETRATARRQRAINGLAWCAQAVVEQAQAMQEAAVGAVAKAPDSRQDGFERERVQRYLQRCAEAYAASGLADTAARLSEISVQAADTGQPLEKLEAGLAAAEERVYAQLLVGTTESALAELRETVVRELAPYRAKMQATHIQQIQRQMLNRKLLEARGLPRLSLFYMPHE